MPEGGIAVAVDKAVNGKRAEPIDQVLLGGRRPIDVLAPAALASKHVLLVQTAHHGHDRGVGMVAPLASAECIDDVGDARLATNGDLANDRGGEWTEHVFELRGSGHGMAPFRRASVSPATNYYPCVVYRPVMEALLADQAEPILEWIALLGLGIAIMLSSVARSRSQRPGNRVSQVFWRDLSQAGFSWAAGTFALLVASLVGIVGLRSPIWLLLAIIAGMVSLALVRLRLRRLGPVPEPSLADDPSRPDRPRLVSTTWEVGILGAGAGGLLVYLASLSHGWGHPIHWLVAGLGALFGYAAGLIAGTPRYALKRGSKASISR